MRSVARRVVLAALGLLLLPVLSGCLVRGGYVVGGYEPSGYEYGRWGPGYRVGPPRGGERRAGAPSQPPSYRPASGSRPSPSIPTRRHGN
jgi:hypothetical protein